jgi:hypothetical protein
MVVEVQRVLEIIVHHLLFVEIEAVDGGGGDDEAIGMDYGVVVDGEGGGDVWEGFEVVVVIELAFDKRHRHRLLLFEIDPSEWIVVVAVAAVVVGACELVDCSLGIGSCWRRFHHNSFFSHWILI